MLIPCGCRRMDICGHDADPNGQCNTPCDSYLDTLRFLPVCEDYAARLIKRVKAFKNATLIHGDGEYIF